MPEPAPLIPREVIFGNPERVFPQISPDGRRLAWLAPDEGVLNVWVQTIGADDARAVTADRERGVRAYAWAHDNRQLIYIQDEGGEEDWHLHLVDPGTGDDQDVTPFDGVQVRIAGLDKRRPNDMLVGLNRRDPQLHDVFHLDLRTRELIERLENPGFVGWQVDCDLRVRGATRPRPDGGLTLLVGEPDDPDSWKPVVDVGLEDSEYFGLLGFSLDGRSLLLITPEDADAARLVRLDLPTGDRQVIAEDLEYDVAGALVHPDTREVQMVTFLKERHEYIVLDASIADDVEAIRALHPGDFGVIGRDHADRTWLVAYTADDGPVSFFAFDRATKAATHLFDHQPKLNEYTLAQMEPFSLLSRDGLTIHGYLTFPAGVERRGLPTVLNVHGGPWTRDTWGFNTEAQWLANRGYLCVQVNYRGSAGYGKGFINAGIREWGGRMHDDLIDAVGWVVAQGYADPEHIAIYGGSYGGYAALVGATFTPDVFRCAVAVVGPSNLKTFIETLPPYWMPMIERWHRRVGNPETDEDFLWSRSPLSRVDEIKHPILVVHGANDPRVKQSESEQIVAAMKEKGIDHEYLLFPDEGHGFAKPENRLKFYAAAEHFLARHIGGRAED